MSHGGDPGLSPVPRRRDEHLGAPRAQRVASERHVGLPAEQAAELAEGEVVDFKVAPVPDSPDEPFATGGHELAMLAEDRAVGADVEQGIIDGRPTRLGVQLIDADRHRHARFASGLAEPVRPCGSASVSAPGQRASGRDGGSYGAGHGLR